MNSDEITLKVTNNSNIDIPISLFGSPQSTNNNTDNSFIIQWDLSTEGYAGNDVVLNMVDSGTFTFTNVFPTNIKDVVDVLNTTDVGSFISVGDFIYCLYVKNPNDKSGTLDILTIP